MRDKFREYKGQESDWVEFARRMETTALTKAEIKQLAKESLPDPRETASFLKSAAIETDGEDRRYREAIKRIEDFDYRRLSEEEQKQLERFDEMKFEPEWKTYFLEIARLRMEEAELSRPRVESNLAHIEDLFSLAERLEGEKGCLLKFATLFHDGAKDTVDYNRDGDREEVVVGHRIKGAREEDIIAVKRVDMYDHEEFSALEAEGFLAEFQGRFGIGVPEPARLYIAQAGLGHGFEEFFHQMAMEKEEIDEDPDSPKAKKYVPHQINPPEDPDRNPLAEKLRALDMLVGTGPEVYSKYVFFHFIPDFWFDFAGLQHKAHRFGLPEENIYSGSLLSCFETTAFNFLRCEDEEVRGEIGKEFVARAFAFWMYMMEGTIPVRANGKFQDQEAKEVWEVIRHSGDRRLLTEDAEIFRETYKKFERSIGEFWEDPAFINKYYSLFLGFADWLLEKEIEFAKYRIDEPMSASIYWSTSDEYQEGLIEELGGWLEDLRAGEYGHYQPVESVVSDQETGPCFAKRIIK